MTKAERKEKYLKTLMTQLRQVTTPAEREAIKKEIDSLNGINRLPAVVVKENGKTRIIKGRIKNSDSATYLERTQNRLPLMEQIKMIEQIKFIKH